MMTPASVIQSLVTPVLALVRQISPYLKHLIQPFNPQRHLAAAIGWVVFVIILAAALVGANLAANQAADQARIDAQRLLAQFATQIRHAIDAKLRSRQALLMASASQILADTDPVTNLPPQQRHVTALQEKFPEFDWIGMADTTGRLVVATDSATQGQMVAGLSWFQRGRLVPFLGDARYEALLEQQSPPSVLTARLPGFVMAVPVIQASGELMGVLGARLSWQWIEQEGKNLLLQLEVRCSLDLLVATADQTVLMGPADWLGRSLGSDETMTEGGRYVVGRNLVPPERQVGLGWIVMLREPAETALVSAERTQYTVFRVVLLAGLVAALSVVFVTRDLMQRLTLLADQAQAVRQGFQENVAVPAGADEISRIGITLADLVGHLQQEKQALATLNAELDTRVTVRTARIARLADESRHTAVVRERLRLARELHDTLAHSLMALLTQIRLIRKLRTRLSDDELEAELAQAEVATAQGLTEARAAISQMRYNSVRDEGLGVALQPLLTRFQERCGVKIVLRADTQAAGFAGERAETVFRILEEALKNVERHAQADTLQITLQWIDSSTASQAEWNPEEAGRIRIEIADDGVGFDPSTPYPGHYGLLGIAEQAELIEASFELHSAPGAGTRLVLELEA